MRVIDYIANNGLFDKLSCDFCVRRPEVLGGGGAKHLNQPDTLITDDFLHISGKNRKLLFPLVLFIFTRSGKFPVTLKE